MRLGMFARCGWIVGSCVVPGPSFQIDHASLVIEDHTILDDVCLDIGASMVTAIVGPSGSGKSTFLRLLNRLIVPTSGKVSVDHTPLDDLDVLALRRRVGMVFQRPTVFEGTVAANLGAADPDLSEDDMGLLLEEVHLPADWVDRDAAELSGGEAQRVCLARTLATRPEAVLMDEVTSALDVENRMALEQLTCRLVTERRLTVVWVSHDLDQVERIGDRVVSMDHGAVVSS